MEKVTFQITPGEFKIWWLIEDKSSIDKGEIIALAKDVDSTIEHKIPAMHSGKLFQLIEHGSIIKSGMDLYAVDNSNHIENESTEPDISDEVTVEETKLTPKEKRILTWGCIGVLVVLFAIGAALFKVVPKAYQYVSDYVSHTIMGDGDPYNEGEVGYENLSADCEYRCNGNGYYDLNCWKCNGNGKVDCDGQKDDGCNNGVTQWGVNCYKCGARGFLNCGICRGLGGFSSPEYALQRIEGQVSEYEETLKTMYLLDSEKLLPLFLRLGDLGGDISREYSLLQTSIDNYVCPIHSPRKIKAKAKVLKNRIKSLQSQLN